MIRLVLDTTGQEEINKIAVFCADLQRKMPDPQVVREAQRIIENGFAESFANEGSAAGRWPQLAPRTVEDRIRRGYSGSHPILVRTGSYRLSWVGDDNGSVPTHIREAASDGSGWHLEVGSSDYRVGWHEHGTPHMPARQVAPASEMFKRQLGDYLDLYYSGLDVSGIVYDPRLRQGNRGGAYRNVATGRIVGKGGKR